MKKYLPFIIIAVVLLIGGVLVLSSMKNGEHANNKPVDQSHRSYEIEVTEKPNADQIALNEPARITYKIKNDKGEALKNFAIAHEKLMHFIVVRKDLMQFQHLHPEFNKETGEFSVDVEFSVDGSYRFFADFTPGQDNPQKLPVALHSDINIGDISKFQPHKIEISTNKDIAVGPLNDNFLVKYTIPPNLNSQKSVTYSLIVEKNGKAVNLEKYLGALGHSVILKEGSLEYIHTHAGEQNDNGQMEHDMHSANTSPQANKIDFSTTFPESGIYRIFTQFQHQGNVFTTEYTVEVK